jgi:hypothetical protein
MKLQSIALAAACAALVSATGAAAQNRAIGVSLGTPGIGVQASAKVNDTLVVRGAIDGMSLNHDEDYSDIEYNGKAKLLTGGIFVDVHPGGGAFLVSGGAYVGRRKLELRALPTSALDIGGQTYTPAQVGRLDGEAKLSDFQPFLGLGIDNTFSGERAWGFRALIGVAFSKEPNLHLTSTGGTLSNDPAFQARLRIEEAQAEDDAKDFKYFPVVQVGLTRRF